MKQPAPGAQTPSSAETANPVVPGMHLLVAPLVAGLLVFGVWSVLSISNAIGIRRDR